MRYIGKRYWLERRLRSERPQPREEFLASVADRLASRPVRHGAGWRVAFAAALTSALVAAFALTGGISYAASAVKQGTTAVTTLVAGSSQATKAKANKPERTKAAKPSSSSSRPSSSSRASAAGSSASSLGIQTSPARRQYEEKVLICHRPPGNPENAHTIQVGASAVPAHLAHGDTLGRCPNGG